MVDAIEALARADEFAALAYHLRSFAATDHEGTTLEFHLVEAADAADQLGRMAYADASRSDRPEPRHVPVGALAKRAYGPAADTVRGHFAGGGSPKGLRDAINHGFVPADTVVAGSGAVPSVDHVMGDESRVRLIFASHAARRTWDDPLGRQSIRFLAESEAGREALAADGIYIGRH